MSVLLVGLVGCARQESPPPPQLAADNPEFLAWLEHATATAGDSITASTASHLQAVLEALGSFNYERLDTLLAKRHIQHNPMLGGDRQSMLDLAAEGEIPRGGMPRLMENTVHLLIAGELALIHRVGQMGPLRSLHFDLLRIDGRGKLLEQWAFVQPVEGSFFDSLLFSFVVPRELDLIPLPADESAVLPGGNPAYAERVARSPQQSRENRTLVLAYLRAISNAAAESDPAAAVETYLAEDFRLHLPGLPQGRDAMRDILNRASRRDISTKQELAIAQNDLVWVLSRLSAIRAEDVPELASADLFRVRDGVIVEQWKIVQPSPRFSRNKNSLF